MFDYLPHIDLQNPESIGDQFSSYFGVSHTPDSDKHLTDLYTGSATQITNRSLIGEAGRLRYGHMKVLELGYDEIYQRRRSPPGSKWKAELWIHEKMTYPGAQYFYVSTTRYPIVSCPSLRARTKVLTVLAENFLLILVGTICPAKYRPRSPQLWRVANICQEIATRLRPQGIPQPLNGVAQINYYLYSKARVRFGNFLWARIPYGRCHINF
jgi:hypothetical protein